MVGFVVIFYVPLLNSYSLQAVLLLINARYLRAMHFFITIKLASKLGRFGTILICARNTVTGSEAPWLFTTLKILTVTCMILMTVCNNITLESLSLTKLQTESTVITLADW